MPPARAIERVDMRPRVLVAGLVLISAAVMLVAPVLAQDATTRVAYGGVAFSLDSSLGPSVNITNVPGTAATPLLPSDPPHLAFGLYGTAGEGDQVERVGWGEFVVRFYPVADIGGYPDSAKNLAQLQRILTARPDLSPYMEASHTGYLPYAPMPEAAQIIRARVHYIDSPQLSGIAYVTAWAQDEATFGATDFWYTFQGLSSDGAWYVSVAVVIDASMFPRTAPTDPSIYATERAYQAYLAQTIAKLNSAGPRKFSPSLTAVNDLVNSITFDSVSALASPSEPVFPVASESSVPAPTETSAVGPTESVMP
jgi:hypothetical protein